jgi:hypothetical protein
MRSACEWICGGKSLVTVCSKQDADDLVLCLAKPLGAAPSVAILEQEFFGTGPRVGERGLEAAGDRGPQFALAPGMGFRQRVEVGNNRRAIDEFPGGACGTLGVQHCGRS